MEFLVLGPLEVRRDGESIDIRGSKRRALLALLILHANEVIRTDRLVDELWGERRPANTQGALQNHVSRLRKDLGEDVLVRKAWGYVLRADPESVDLRRFEALVTEARTLAARERRAKLAQALELWRGHPLADIADEPALTADVARLEELRLSALEQRIDTDLELGAESGLVAELEDLVAQHPLRERLRGQLILALYRAGRQADALETYRETRRMLVEELGIEPGPELRELEQAILRHDPALKRRSRPAPDHIDPHPPPPSPWRWLRSAFAFSATLLLVGAGVLAAVLLTRSGTPASAPATVASTQATTIVVTTETTAPRPPTTTTRQPRRRHQQRPVTHMATTVVAPTTVKATTASTTTARPTTVTIPKPPATPLSAFITDSFDGAPDASVWNTYSTGSGPTVAQHDGKVEVFLPGDATGWGTYHQIAGQYETRCHFPADFDARIEFELVEWPPSDHVNVALAGFMSDYFPQVIRQSVNDAEIYAGAVQPPKSVPTNDRSGRLRIARHDGVFTTYYWSWRLGDWVALAHQLIPGDVRINIAAITTEDVFGKQDVRVDFDNFVVFANKTECP